MGKHHRRSIRLRGYDYSKPGAYFVTICCKDRQCYFGRVENGDIKLSAIGRIVRMNWEYIPHRFESVILDQYVIMPNHLHGIIYIIRKDENVGRGLINQTPSHTMNVPTAADNYKSIQNRESANDYDWILMKNPILTLGKIIRFFKARTTRFIRRKGYKNFAWQRNYYEKIIRNEYELEKTRNYIIENPLKLE